MVSEQQRSLLYSLVAGGAQNSLQVSSLAHDSPTGVCLQHRHTCHSLWWLIKKVAEQQHRCWLRSLSWRD